MLGLGLGLEMGLGLGLGLGLGQTLTLNPPRRACPATRYSAPRVCCRRSGSAVGMGGAEARLNALRLGTWVRLGLG